jgi:hypothetical protein
MKKLVSHNNLNTVKNFGVANVVLQKKVCQNFDRCFLFVFTYSYGHFLCEGTLFYILYE